MKYDISNDSITRINDTYKFILLLNSFYFWNTVKLSISVNNSVGASPYSDYYTIEGAINCKFLCFFVMLNQAHAPAAGYFLPGFLHVWVMVKALLSQFNKFFDSFLALHMDNVDGHYPL